jgi:dihydropteroate synthase
MSFKNTLLPVQCHIQSKGKLLDLSKPVVMGILNVTPDSFYTQGRYNSVDGMLTQATEMIASGARILDIGGASSRPGAAIVSVHEELDRVIPVIASIHRQFPDCWLSIDTYHAVVAAAAINAGAKIVNDISAGSLDANMLKTVAGLGVPYIAMHMQGTPDNMQQNPLYDNISLNILDYLQKVSSECQNAGITDLLIDPGFGFGKTIKQNYELLNNMSVLRTLEKPILAGISRKSMIYKAIETDADAALNGTTALHMVCLQQGASILRVHDVKEAMEAIKLFEML